MAVGKRQRWISAFNASRFTGKLRIGAIVRRVPGKIKARVGACSAKLVKVIHRHAGSSDQRVIAFVPDESVRSMWVKLQAFQQAPISLPLQLVHVQKKKALSML